MHVQPDAVEVELERGHVLDGLHLGVLDHLGVGRVGMLYEEALYGEPQGHRRARVRQEILVADVHVRQTHDRPERLEDLADDATHEATERAASAGVWLVRCRFGRLCILLGLGLLLRFRVFRHGRQCRDELLHQPGDARLPAGTQHLTRRLLQRSAVAVYAEAIQLDVDESLGEVAPRDRDCEFSHMQRAQAQRRQHRVCRRKDDVLERGLVKVAVLDDNVAAFDADFSVASCAYQLVELPSDEPIEGEHLVWCLANRRRCVDGPNLYPRRFATCCFGFARHDGFVISDSLTQRGSVPHDT